MKTSPSINHNPLNSDKYHERNAKPQMEPNTSIIVTFHENDDDAGRGGGGCICNL